MNDYLPVIAVFAIGFIGYLGKAGVDSILASRRKAKAMTDFSPTDIIIDYTGPNKEITKEIRESSTFSCNICGAFTTAKLCPKCRPVQEEFLEKQQHARAHTPTQSPSMQPPSWLKTPKTDFHNLHFFKPAEHSAVIRIMESAPGLPLFTAARQHYVSPTKNRVYQCGKTRSEESNRWEGECTICDLYEHKVSKFHSSQRDAKKYKPTERFYYNVNQGGVVRIWSVSRKVHEQIQKAIMSEDIVSSEKGKDIEVWTQRNKQFPSVKDVKLKFLHPTPNNHEDSLPWDLEAYNKHCEKDLLKAITDDTDDTYKGCPTVPKPEAEANPCNEVGWQTCGGWVTWVTKAGTESIRPSIVYDVEKKIDGTIWWMLKYKQSGGFMSFWIQAEKCTSVNPSKFERDHIENMYKDWISQ